MKQGVIIFLLLLSSALSALAQNATNVRVRQEGETIVITYDLDKEAIVRLLVATGQSNQYIELKAVSGSGVGKDISAGVNKQIIWQPLQEKTEFVAQNVRFKVEATLNYYFSVSKTKRVVFSPGNLQYTQSTQTWSFAEHQYDMIGKANVRGSRLANKIDLFGWSNGNSAKWGVSTSYPNSNYSGDFVDWGKNIGDGKTWYTLTKDEWYYLCNIRTKANKLIGVARINFSANSYAIGLILLPDNWTCPANITFQSNSANKVNVLELSDWLQLEVIGAVFLPAMGYRIGLDICYVNSYGFYWSATPHGLYNAYSLGFRFAGVFIDKSVCHYGQAVRLVRDL